MDRGCRRRDQLLSSATGGLIASYASVKPGQTLTLNNQSISAPFGIPSPPVNGSTCGIPANPPAVVVGIGLMGTNSQVAVIREQYWVRLDSSISVAPGETKQCAYSITTGVSTSESSSKTLEASATAGISAGWGPFSASVSASLSASSSSSQTIEMQEESTSSVVETYTGNAVKAGALTNVYVTWQLMNVLLWFSSHPTRCLLILPMPR